MDISDFSENGIILLNLLDFLRGFFNSLNHNFKFLFHYYFLRVIYKLIV